MVNTLRYGYLVALCLLTLGCAQSPKETAIADEVYDPLEGFNRTMWALNYEVLDPYLLRPAAVGYTTYTPSPLRRGLSNFANNLDEPASMVNNLMMGNAGRAFDHFNRFWINSTFGLLGLLDIASEAGITKHDDKEFGDAVGYYGVGNGPFLMVPGVGPMTLRDSTDVVDSLYVPLSLLTGWVGIGKFAVEGLEGRAALISQEAMLENSPDPYSLVRDVYLQRQDFKAEIEVDTSEQDEAELEELDAFLEEF